MAKVPSTFPAEEKMGCDQQAAKPALAASSLNDAQSGCDAMSFAGSANKAGVAQWRISIGGRIRLPARHGLRHESFFHSLAVSRGDS